MDNQKDKDIQVLLPVLPLNLNSSEYSALPFVDPFGISLKMNEELEHTDPFAELDGETEDSPK